MKNRIVALSAAAIIGIAGLSACGPDAATPGGSVTTASGPGTATPEGPVTTATDAEAPGNPHFSDSVDAVAFVTDLVKANAESYRSNIVGTATDPDGSILEAVTTREVETVDGVLHTHTVFTFDGETSESITIGKDSWSKTGDIWEKVPDGAISLTTDTASGLGDLQDNVQDVTYMGSGGAGHQFTVTITASEETMPDSDGPTTATIHTDDNLRITTIESSNSIAGSTITTVEERSEHGGEFGIDAPAT